MPLILSERLTFKQAAALRYVDTELCKLAAMNGGCLTKNQIKETENFSGSTPNWDAFQLASRTLNEATSPRGDKTMNKLIEDGTLNVHIVRSGAPAVFVFTAYAQIAVSIYAKAVERTWLVLGCRDAGGGGDAKVFYNLAAGTVGSYVGDAAAIEVSKSIESVGDGIYRCKFVYQRPSGSSGEMYFGLAQADLVDSYTGDGTSGIYVWGAQVEDQSGVVHCYNRHPAGPVIPFVQITPEVYAKTVYDYAVALEAEDAVRA